MWDQAKREIYFTQHKVKTSLGGKEPNVKNL
jgi:hypothetical protein